MNDKKPNIVFILSDDLSYRDIGCYGQTYIKTPNLDRLCSEGMKFTNAYSAAPICGPSRCGLLTGKHMGHSRIREHGQPVEGGNYQESLHNEDHTIGDVMKSAGYATAAIGKWAIGVEGTDAIPNYKGFDYSFGFYDQNYAHTFYPEYVWENGKRYELLGNRGFDMTKRYRMNYSRYDTKTSDDNEYDSDGNLILRELTHPEFAQNTYDLCEEKALDFIRKNKENPFFLYFAIQNPHGPLIVPSIAPYTDDDRFPSLRHKEWAAIITRLDTGVGRITALLDELALTEDTILLFASDNGYSAWGYFGLTMNDEVSFFNHKGEFRGSKFTLDGEAGIRVPLFFKWKNHIPAGTVTEQLAPFWDLLPTFAEFAGAEIPDCTDGLSLVPTLLGNPDKQIQHEYLYWEQNHMQALRIGDFKLFRRHPSQKIEVYNIAVDTYESDDISDLYPELVKRAEEIFITARTDSDIFINPGETDQKHRNRLNSMNLTPNSFAADDPARQKWIDTFE